MLFYAVQSIPCKLAVCDTLMALLHVSVYILWGPAVPSVLFIVQELVFLLLRLLWVCLPVRTIHVERCPSIIGFCYYFFAQMFRFILTNPLPEVYLFSIHLTATYSNE